MPKPARDFIFAVDLDGCVVDFYKALRPIAADWLNKPVEELTEDFSYGFAEWGMPTEGELRYSYLHRHAVKQHEIFKTAPPIAGAAYTLRRLSSAGVHIRIATHRLYVGGTHETVINHTVNWLEQHAVPYMDLCFLKDKTSVNADMYIDDSPTNIQRFEQKKKNYIIYHNSTNRSCNGPRAHNWDQVYDLVIQAMTQKASQSPTLYTGRQ